MLMSFTATRRLQAKGNRPPPGAHRRLLCPSAGSVRATASKFGLTIFLTALFLAGQTGSFGAVATPLEFRQQGTTYNLLSQRGVPISTSANNAGSDGRLPTSNESFGSANPATTNQFRGFVSFGAIGAPTNTLVLSNSITLNSGTNTNFQTASAAMQLPAGVVSNAVYVVMRRVQVGAPYLSRQVSFLFGAVITVPESDETGASLTNIVKEAYWLPEPYTTDGHASAGYYWSPNSRQVYAVQAGPVSITWRKAASTITQPSDYSPTNANYNLVGGNYYRLFSKSYVISGSAVKTPRKIYWTEKSFQNLGKLVTVPTARVGAVAIAYNNNFPRTNSVEYTGPGQSRITDGTTNSLLPELRTLWFDQEQGNIHAYNQEGRVFVELLGDTSADGQSRVQLGSEIVDVYKQVNPIDLISELGSRITPPPPGTITNLFPEPVLQSGGTPFAFQHNVAGSDTTELYATRETQNVNDYMVHWMEVGAAGLRWPSQFARYQLVWPSDAAKYSHYIRPLAATDSEAQQTAVPLATENVPIIQYQDALDVPRGKLTADFKFYTFLTPAYPAHRTLLRFTSGENISFERVFSWLDVNLKATNFAGSVATSLSAWNPTNNTMTWQDPSTAPIVTTNITVEVGQRINAPGADTSSAYRAGYIQQSAGTLFDVNAYLDPFARGFAAASLGAIIPVNAVPGANNLEVWWFRTNNAATANGFVPIFWPSMIGRYTIQWPAAPGEIVLAGNNGNASDAASNPLLALGSIYAQGNQSLPGYNPNEEHAIMIGGTAYALRDDLNITNVNGYSSHRFVLVEYPDADGRPSMRVYKVLREKPETGFIFDTPVTAGTVLQPPMPLGSPALMPVEGTGDGAINYNTESSQAGGDLPGGWTDGVDSLGPFGHYQGFTYRDRKQAFWVYRGPHAGLPPLQAGAYNPTNRTFNPLPVATAVAGQFFSYAIHVSREDKNLSLSLAASLTWLTNSSSSNPGPGPGLFLLGTPGASNIGTNTVQVIVRDVYDQTSVTNSLTIRVVTNGTGVAQGPLVIQSTNSYTGTTLNFTNRPPFLAHSPTPTNSFTMRYYYKTQPSFDWPGVTNPPAVGAIVPYLRAFSTVNNAYIGGPFAKTNALDIVYRPAWPEGDNGIPLPLLPYGQTLTEPPPGGNGLPGVRDFKTANILYQQSIARNITSAAVSAVLHDPTRQKIGDLYAQGLTALPGGVQANYYQGKYYFPQLPPHLSTRLFYDANRGTNGSLVLTGEYKPESTGESYLLLNVLRDDDLAKALALCPSGDKDFGKWNTLVSGLATQVEVFHENPDKPGTFVANPSLTATVGVGDLASVTNENTAVDSYALSGTGPGSGYITLVEAGGAAFTKPGDPVVLHILKVGGSLYAGELKAIPSPNPLSEQITLQHTGDFAGRAAEYAFQWKIGAPTDGLPPVADPPAMSGYATLVSSSTGLVRYTIGGAGVTALSDNYLIMRYRPINPQHPLYKANPADTDWSAWTRPQLAEGWIKRALAGINPFNQRTTDLFDNRVNTDVSIISQAGQRWEGAIALNADTLNDHGLIEIYETILRRGRMLSIEAQPGINYGPANDALLLAAGYLNDLYMTLGNEAWADAANPTIGIGTKDNTYGDIATALFSFKGQEPSLLEEELALLRGRDDFLQPSIEVAPFYNRLVWNYTRGINSGEVIYALNYNILDQDSDGVVGAADAAILYPQAHGDAYGHYLTALMGYYSLLMNPNFDWVPRIEAVLVLGQPVSVDYLDERKFAGAAAAVARAGKQVFDLTWRKDYQPGHSSGWDYLSTNRVNGSRTFVNLNGGTNASVRNWGLDHWAARTGGGAYLNWVVGNAILPAVDPNPTHEGIQKVDRTTVPELQELPSDADSLQVAMDNAEGGLTPLGLPSGSLAFDINPNQVLGAENGTHFEQVYERANVALRNAVAAFDDAKDVTRLMRSEQNSLVELQLGVEKQEMAYTNALIEIYGTSYPDDTGPGQTYPQGYAGPDLLHFAYVEAPQLTFTNLVMPNVPSTNRIDLQNYSADYEKSGHDRFDFVTTALNNNPDYKENIHFVTFTLDADGDFQKPSNWGGKRPSPGKLQDAISRIQLARNATLQALDDNKALKRKLDLSANYFSAKLDLDEQIHGWDSESAIIQTTVEGVTFAGKIGKLIYDQFFGGIEDAAMTAMQAIPGMTIVGLANGGDILSGARAAILGSYAVAKEAAGPLSIAKEFVVGALKVSKDGYLRQREADVIGPATRDLEDKRQVLDLDAMLGDVQTSLFTINQRLQELDDARRNYQALRAQGDRLQAERLVFRQRSAALIQGYRTRDAAFRLFRDEKLERYKTLFDLTTRYAYLAANAYDYETGLLNTDQGRSFIARIINSRALGVVRNGEPQYAGSNTGDPGISSVLAEMKADWDVLRGRLGFNNPDANGTTASLRTENYRVLPGTNGIAQWQDLMRQHRKANLLEDADVRRYCMQIDSGNGLAVPGLIFEFSTVIDDGLNLFGQQLAPGDHAYSPSSFATKIFAAGIAFEGYRGMDNPAANTASVASAGGATPSDPPSWYLDPMALAANPYVYLIPVGVDAMRSPPLGDTSTIRTWAVDDVAIPLPFNIGASDFSSKGVYLSSDSLSEQLFTIRKHQSFRPVSSPSFFSTSLYGVAGTLKRSQYTNNRLIGRSVWNTKWKLVIPAQTLLNNSAEGLDRFIQSVTDIKLHFVTYSYSGN